MHHLVVKNNLVEGKTTKLGYKGGGDHGGNDLPVCRKPCRPNRSTTINPCELVKPFKSPTKRQSQANLDGRSDILNMIITDKKTTEDREFVCLYRGSPPQRTDNPLIHDVQFVNRMKLFSPLASLKK